MAITYDFSNWPEALYEFSLDQLTYLDWLEVDCSTHALSEAENASDLRVAALARDKYAYWAWWLRFSTGVECLVKAVFLKNRVSLLRKKHLVEKAPQGAEAMANPVAAHVYRTIMTGSAVTANSNPWLKDELARLGINHPFEINSGTLGKYRNKLPLLTQNGAIDAEQELFVGDALEVLGDIRRNVDAHVFLKMQTAGSINGDLLNLYIPACNILINAFHNGC